MARYELWVEVADRPGNLAALAGDLAACGANIVHLDIQPGNGVTAIDRLVVQVADDRGVEVEEVARRCGGHLIALDDANTGSVPVVSGPVVVRSAVSLTPQHPAAPPARRSPVTLERLVALADGGLVRLRHLSHGDGPALAAFRRRCSDGAGSRGRGPTPDPGAQPEGAVALAALAGADIVGVARYELADGGRRADVDVVVEDVHQRRGIGALLVNELATLASNAGVDHLRAVDPSGGERLARTLHRGGLDTVVHRQGEALVLDCTLPHGLSASA